MTNSQMTKKDNHEEPGAAFGRNQKVSHAKAQRRKENETTDFTDYTDFIKHCASSCYVNYDVKFCGKKQDFYG